MNFAVLGRFLFGNARAIRKVASDRSTLWTGIALVLLTGIARNYDQNYFLETPMWLVGPLLFSFFSGSFLFWVLVRRFARRHFREDARQEKQWRGFMGLFWMTAPIAWLYAIPVERFLAPYPAAQANLALLGIVSFWRVLLMSRIMAVLFGISFARALGRVLLAASLEIILVLFFGAFGDAFNRRILEAMAGMRNSPEEALLSKTLGLVWGYSWAVLLICIVVAATRPFQGVIPPLPKPSPGRIPWLSLAMLVVIWSLIAIPSQLEQRRYVTHSALVEKGSYLDAVAYLAQYQPADFPPARRLRPDPYDFGVWQDLPPTIGSLNSNTPEWIRRVYLSHLAATFFHNRTGYNSLTNVAAMFSALEQLPEGKGWLLTNQIALAKQGSGAYARAETLDANEVVARANILNTLRRMGMAETNLARLERPER